MVLKAQHRSLILNYHSTKLAFEMENRASLKNTIKSVAAAFIGVQSNKNREKDFSEGKFSHFVIIGLLAVVLFIISLLSIVSLVIN